MVNDQLRQLLLEHDCVTLPGLGALLAEPVPARLHPVRHTLSPPARRLAFSDRIRHDDGLLTEAVGRAMGQADLTPARQRVLSFTEELRAALRQHRFAELHGLGKLHQTTDADPIRFEAAEPGYLPLADSFGLPELVSRPILTDRRPARFEIPASVGRPQLRQPGRLRRLLAANSEPLYRLATAVLVTLGLSAAYFNLQLPAVSRLLPGPETVMVASEPQPQRAVVGQTLPEEPVAPVPKLVAEAASTVPETTPAVTKPALADAPAAKSVSTAAPAVAAPATSPAPTPVVAALPKPAAAPAADFNVVREAAGRYHLVWNAFSSKRQAEKGMRQALKIAGDSGLNPMVLAPQRGGRLYRVVVGDYATPAEAAQDLPTQRARFGAALWVLRY